MNNDHLKLKEIRLRQCVPSHITGWRWHLRAWFSGTISHCLLIFGQIFNQPHPAAAVSKSHNCQQSNMRCNDKDIPGCGRNWFSSGQGTLEVTRWHFTYKTIAMTIVPSAQINDTLAITRPQRKYVRGLTKGIRLNGSHYVGRPETQIFVKFALWSSRTFSYNWLEDMRWVMLHLSFCQLF